MKMILIWFLALFPILGPDSPDEETPLTRPVADWVLRTHLDGQPGTLVAILHPYLTVSYDPRKGGLFKVWRGTLEKHGPGYDKDMKGYSSPRGFPFEDHLPGKAAWRVLQKGQNQLAQAHLAGYRIEAKQLFLRYELMLKNGQKVVVEEYPEYLDVKRPDNRTGFIREFKILEGPVDVEVQLHIEVSDLVGKNDIKSSSKIKNITRMKRMFEWGNTYRFEGDMILDREESTTLEVIYTINAETEARRRSGG